jgi:hypothetical protein
MRTIRQNMELMVAQMRKVGANTDAMETALENMDDSVAEALAPVDNAIEAMMPLIANLTAITGNLATVTDALASVVEAGKSLIPTQGEATAMHEAIDPKIDALRERQIAAADAVRRVVHETVVPKLISLLPTGDDEVTG